MSLEPMLTAATEADARAQLSSLHHACGDSTFAPPMIRSHDEHGLWLVFRGACPRCTEPREVRFHSKRPLPRAERVPGFTSITGPEERELYGTTVTRVCSACEGKGQVFEVTGDYAADYVTCRSCSGSGNV